MKNNFTKNLFLLICSVILFPQYSFAQSKANGNSANKLKIDVVDGFLIVIKIKVNGSEKSFFVDTGSTTSAVSNELAKEMKLSSLGTTDLYSTSETKKVDWSRVNLKMGSKEFADVPVLITDFSAIKTHSDAINGVLGNNVLENFNYLIDFKNREFVIEDVDEIGGKLTGESLRFKKVDGRMLITANSVTNKIYSLVIDSGSITPILFVDGKLVKPEGNLYNVAGSVSFEKTTFDWKFGNSSNFVGTGVKIVKNSSRTEDGILPIHFFDLVYINNQYKILMFNPELFQKK